MKDIVAIYPGSFDPVTNGHLDLIHRGSKLFDRLIVAIASNMDKAEPLFDMDERKEMLEAMTSELDNVTVDIFDGLLVTYCIQENANAVLRGIRAVSDYEFELQMALMNRKMEPRVETVFMMPAEKYSYLSSRIVREIAKLGGPLAGLVPELVEERVRRKIAQKQSNVTPMHLKRRAKSCPLPEPSSRRSLPIAFNASNHRPRWRWLLKRRSCAPAAPT